MPGPRPTSPLPSPLRTPTPGASPRSGVAESKAAPDVGTWRNPASAERVTQNRTQSAPSPKKLIDLARRPTNGGTKIPFVVHRLNSAREPAEPIETMETSDEPTSQSGRESAPPQEKSEDIPPMQTLAADARSVQTQLKNAPSMQVLSEQTEQIREVQQANERPELGVQEPRLEYPAAKLENPAPLAKEDAAPAAQQDIGREAPQPEGRDGEPTREQLKQAQKLLSELQQAYTERFNQLDQDQRRLTELAALISKAIERDDKEAGGLADPGSRELPTPKAHQSLREVEPEQRQQQEEKHQMPKHAGERRSLAEVFKVFKKM